MPANRHSRGNSLNLLLAALLLAGFALSPLRPALAAAHEATVTTTADTADGNTSSITALNSAKGADGAISLREAILAANNSPAGDVLIDFAIPDDDPGHNSARGVWTIELSTPLPALSRGDTTIDGSTQAGAGARPSIVLDGQFLADCDLTCNGLTITSADNTVRRLALVFFWDAGVLISGAAASGNRIVGSLIGLPPDANVKEPNYIGIELRNGASDNTIGGPAARDRNIISGNDTYGVFIGGATTKRNTVVGNWIGLGHGGDEPLGNTRGVEVTGGASENTIGVPGAGNVISANYIGVEITSGAAKNSVAANIIGLGADGTTSAAVGGATLGNIDGGIFITLGSSENTVGGAAEAERNVISNNGATGTVYGDGVYIDGANTRANQVIGNYIGVDASGVIQRGNRRYGVSITSTAAGNFVGKDSPASGNVIAYNGGGGIRISSKANQVAYNVIGLGADRQTPLGNQNNGIDVDGEANTIGPDNLIAYNQLSGIVVNGATTSVQHNTLHHNDHSGICVAGSNTSVSNNEVFSNGGRTTTRTRCNIQGGVVVDNASGTLISANSVYDNRDVGIRISGGSRNSISINSISGNAQAGIQLEAGGNQGLAPPVLSVSFALVNGQACSLCTVEIFADPNDEGGHFLGKTTADASGAFAFEFVNAAVSEPHLTATNTDSAGNTSSFAAPQAIPREEPQNTNEQPVFLPLVSR